MPGKGAVGAWITNGSNATFGSTTLDLTTTGPIGTSTLVDGGDTINVVVGPPEPIPMPAPLPLLGAGAVFSFSRRRLTRSNQSRTAA